MALAPSRRARGTFHRVLAAGAAIAAAATAARTATFTSTTAPTSLLLRAAASR